MTFIMLNFTSSCILRLTMMLTCLQKMSTNPVSQISYTVGKVLADFTVLYVTDDAIAKIYVT